MDFTKRIAAMAPEGLQRELRRVHYHLQILKGTFVTGEPEFKRLAEWVKPGDWVIDVGANVGHYTHRLSELVGRQGRVISFEPVPETFADLTSNSRLSKFDNITLVNAAASDKTTVVGMSMPTLPTGLKNYSEASIDSAPEVSAQSVLTLSIDSLKLEHRISLIKIDAEGHEPFVLRGLRKLLERDTPTLIVETVTEEVRTLLLGLGYAEERMPHSPNFVFSAPR
ncbi:MAG TPA: FkbM family methyltransferase [Polyangiaceae bacterium]